MDALHETRDAMKAVRTWKTVLSAQMIMNASSYASLLGRFLTSVLWLMTVFLPQPEPFTAFGKTGNRERSFPRVMVLN